VRFAKQVTVIAVILSCVILPACSNKHESQTLSNTSWTLKSLGNANNMALVLHGGTINLTFSDDQKSYSGFDSVNSYGGTCKIKGNTISIGTTTQTLIGTTDQELSRQLATYHNLLPQASSFNITNDELTLNCDGGQLLIFSRVGP